MESHSWITLVSIVLLVGCSAFFSAAETAISTFNKIRMRKKAEDGDEGAKKVLKIWARYDKTLSSILIGNNIVNITASTMAAAYLTALLGAARGTLAATAIMTVTVLAFGEILPKSYGKDNAEALALRVAGPLLVISMVLTPLSAVFLKLTDLLKGRSGGERAPSITEEELIYMMDTIEEEGVLEEQERDLVQSALEFDEIPIRDILTPRVNITAIDAASTPEDIKRVITETGYSRIPVYENTVDNIIGVLYTRDFLLALVNGRAVSLRDMLGEPLFVHKGMKLSSLLQSFKAKKLHIAVVVDEYGGTAGIVTMEDVLEELVGDIWDEDDEIPAGFTETGADSYEAEGDFDLQELLLKLHIEEDSADSEYSTVGGWALHTMGHIPELFEAFTFLNYRFTVLEMDGHRLKKLGIQKLPEPGPQTRSNEDEI